MMAMGDSITAGFGIRGRQGEFNEVSSLILSPPTSSPHPLSPFIPPPHLSFSLFLFITLIIFSLEVCLDLLEETLMLLPLPTSSSSILPIFKELLLDNTLWSIVVVMSVPHSRYDRAEGEETSRVEFRGEKRRGETSKIKGLHEGEQ